MSELEKNLRALADAPGYAADICNQAAERIAELEAALAAILALGHTADPAGDAHAMRGIARCALGGAIEIAAAIRARGSE